MPQEAVWLFSGVKIWSHWCQKSSIKWVNTKQQEYLYFCFLHYSKKVFFCLLCESVFIKGSFDYKHRQGAFHWSLVFQIANLNLWIFGFCSSEKNPAGLSVCEIQLLNSLTWGLTLSHVMLPVKLTSGVPVGQFLGTVSLPLLLAPLTISWF